MDKFKEFLKWVFMVALSGCLTPYSSKLLEKIPWEKVIDGSSYQWFVSPIFSVTILDIIVFLILLVIVITASNIVKKKISTRKANTEDEQKADALTMLKSFNNIFVDEGKTIEARWKVYEPGMYNSNYWIGSLTFYCHNHPYPLKMKHNRCSDPNCPNSKFYLNQDEIKNHIESMVIQKSVELHIPR